MHHLLGFNRHPFEGADLNGHPFIDTTILTQRVPSLPFTQLNDRAFQRQKSTFPSGFVCKISSVSSVVVPSPKSREESKNTFFAAQHLCSTAPSRSLAWFPNLRVEVKRETTKKWIWVIKEKQKHCKFDYSSDIEFTPSPIINHGSGKWLCWEGDYYWREPFPHPWWLWEEGYVLFLQRLLLRNAWCPQWESPHLPPQNRSWCRHQRTKANAKQMKLLLFTF